jgi:invasion protein IalB
MKLRERALTAAILAIAVVSAVALSALSPVSAATRHKQAAAPAQSENFDGTLTAPAASWSITPSLSRSSSTHSG